MTVYLKNALGFFVQYFPCALMIFLPFPQEVFRFQKKNIFAGTALSAAVLAALFPAAMHSMAGWSIAFAANLYMFGVILLALAVFNWLVRDALIKKVLIFFVVLFYAVVQYWAVNAISGILSRYFRFFLEREPWSVYSSHGLVMYAATTALLLPLMLFFVIRPLGEYIQEVETQQMRRECSVLIVSTVIIIVLLIYVDVTYYSLEYRLYLKLLTLFPFMLLNQVLVFWLVFRESVRRKQDNERQRVMEIQQLQYDRIAGDIENTRRMRHDLRHHYNSLREMLDQGKLEEMKEYLSEMIDATAQRVNEVYCKNMTVNGLLQYYAGLARDEGIRCDIQAECGELAIEPADLTVLFGNAMENAVNACRKCPQNRWISVQVGTVRGSLAIEISNSCQGVRLDRRYQGADGFSPAGVFLSDRAGGGYGLSSISHTAQKYGGSAQFRYNAEREMFTTRIRLNIPADM